MDARGWPALRKARYAALFRTKQSAARLANPRALETFPATRTRMRDSSPDGRLLEPDPSLRLHSRRPRPVTAPEKTEIPSTPQGMSLSLAGAGILECAEL